jgi:hypothetical protein
MNVAKEDYKFLNPGGAPDPDFSPERNKAVIDSTIKKYHAMRRKKIKEYNAGIMERAEAAAYYLKAREMGGNNVSNIVEYFGKAQLRQLTAQKLEAKVLSRRNKVMKLGASN